MGNENVRGPRSYETKICISDGWRPSLGMLKVKVVVAMRMVASRSQGCGKQCEQCTDSSFNRQWGPRPSIKDTPAIDACSSVSERAQAATSMPSIYDLIRVTGWPAFRRASMNGVI